MCGIAGVLRLGPEPIDPRRIRPMCDALAHRGPDDAGYALFRRGGPRTNETGYWVEFTDQAFIHLNEHLPGFEGEYARREFEQQQFDLALGHRRLSILDLSQLGHQPMATPDRALWTAFNGEIYNFRELREELVARGHVFRTRSDTEVLLALWRDGGADALERLDGMFAFALYDRVAGTLTLVRDRFGVKPLYWATAGDWLVFGSEPKALLASGLIEPRLDPASLAQYVTFQNLYGERVIFEGMNLLPPGRALRFRIGQREPESWTFHDGTTGGPVDPGLEYEGASERVFLAFREAVRRQLVSDVPVGAYLSGGMDSGSIVAVAAQEIPRLTTFTGGFDLTNVSGIEQGFDERQLAEKLSYLMQTEHYDVVLHAGDMPAAMERLTWHVDDPRLGMCHQNWYVAKLASRFVKVCLAGAGGDELFGGYPWRYRPALDARSVDEFDERYFAYWHRLLPREELGHLLADGLRPHLDDCWVAFREILGEPGPSPAGEDDLSSRLLNRALRFEFRTFLHGFLMIEDRLSMAHSLESRVPFLDNALAALAWSLPSRFKVDLASSGRDEGHVETADGKLVLRRAMEHLLPTSFTRQRKQGFSPPDENWYRGPSMGYVKEILLDGVTARRDWLDAKFAASRLEEHFRGERNHRLLIWSLLSLEWLQRHYIDGSVPGKA